MKRILLMLVCLIMMSITASAFYAEVDGIYYEFNEDDFTASTACNYQYNSDKYTGEIEIPAEVEYEYVKYTVTAIGYSTFSDQSSLTSVKIPNSITSIGSDAFAYCSSLSTIQFPSNLISIGDGAFEECSALTSISIPNSVTYIGYSAFRDTGWYNAQPFGLLYIDNCLVDYKGALNGNYIVDDGTRLIASRIFGMCGGLYSITIPNSVKHIGAGAFSECRGLAYANLPSGLTDIEERLFGDCNNLKSITIPEGVKSIGKSAFTHCNGLTTITIPEGVTSIGEWAFSDCINLSSILFPSSLTSIGADAFGGTPWYDNQPQGLVYVGKIAYRYKGEMPANTHIEIEEGTLQLCSGLFAGFSNLVSITIPNSVKDVGGATFSNCLGLTSITIPNSVEEIGNTCLFGCSNLKNLTIGSGVKHIGSQAFWGCALESVTVLAETPPAVDNEEVFSDYLVPLLVPESAALSYMSTSPWSTFTMFKNLDGEEIKKQKCAKPTITVCDGYLAFACETEEVEYHFSITNDNFPSGSTLSDIIPFSKKIVITLYASKAGWENSDTTTLELDDIKVVGDLNGDGTVNVADHVTLSEMILSK